MTEHPSLVGQEISGCEILNKVAEGGMGAVYKARHKALNRIVCVKILSPSLANDKKAVELFLTEARAIAELDHPNIVNVYNVGKERGYYFIVMSFIEGQTLSVMLKKHKILPIGLILDLFEGVLLGLQAAHEKGIIHRDIKPSNILINPQGQPKLVDFGIAKKVDKEKGSTKTTELAGTAYFIAPEQALGKDLDTRADLYSLGASLYYVLTGQFPYNGKNTIDIIQKHINDPIPNPAKIRSDMPGWLSLAVQKLMSKNPDDRFQTAKETYLYFKKMRAEDQLRVKMGNSGRAIDLGEEGPLRIVKEEKTTTASDRETVQKLRAQEAALKKRTTSSSRLPLMPQLDASVPDATARKPRKPEEKIQMLPAKGVKPVDVFMPAKRPSSRFTQNEKIQEMSGDIKQVLKLVVFVPLFLVFAWGISYLFHTLGTICSVHVNANAGLISNLVMPFFAAEYAPNQMTMTGLAVAALALILASSSIRAFSRSTLLLLIVALVAYMSGLFTPNVPFMELANITQFIFTPEYYLCYLVFAMAWAMGLCWTLNRTVSQGILGAALVALSLVLVYLSSHLSIVPDAQSVFVKIVFYAALFCGVLCVYYLLSRTEKENMLFPLVLLLASVVGIWMYSVSGLASNINRTLNTLTKSIVVKDSFSAQSNEKMEELIGIDSRRAAFSSFDKTNELTGLSDQKVLEFLDEQVSKEAPGVFDEKTKPLFLYFLLNYYRGGESKMKFAVWDYAVSFPVQNFNRNAEANDAYFFLLALLYAFGALSCAGTIFFSEDL